MPITGWIFHREFQNPFDGRAPADHARARRLRMRITILHRAAYCITRNIFRSPRLRSRLGLEPATPRRRKHPLRVSVQRASFFRSPRLRSSSANRNSLMRSIANREVSNTIPLPFVLSRALLYDFSIKLVATSKFRFIPASESKAQFRTFSSLRVCVRSGVKAN